MTWPAAPPRIRIPPAAKGLRGCWRRRIGPSPLSNTLKINGIAVVMERQQDLTVAGYPNEYAQVLLNILNNAKDVLIERRISEPRISVRMERNAQRAVVTISDNGGGIAEEPVDRIFDPYYTTKDLNKGTGIGLYIAKAIIENSMHGRISVQNTTEGAEFRIEV